MDISQLSVPHCRIGEAALWDHRSGQLFLVDILKKRVFRHDPISGNNDVWEAPVAPGALGLRAGGGLVLAMHDSVYALDVEQGEFRMIAGPVWQDPRKNMNDGAVSREGRFIIGCSHHEPVDPEPIGGLFIMEAGQGLRQLDSGVRWSNSCCFSPDGRTLYFSDSKLHTMYAYDYDPATGDTSNRRVFAETHSLGGVPDGSTVDADGLVWMAVFKGSKIVAFRPDGAVERIVDLPVSLPSSVAFGGPNLDILYVTSIDTRVFDEPADDRSGFTYAIHGLGQCGLPEPLFAG
jgi:L-arabinonolactonase